MSKYVFYLKSLSLNLNVEALSGTLTLYVLLRVEPLCGTLGEPELSKSETLGNLHLYENF